MVTRRQLLHGLPLGIAGLVAGLSASSAGRAGAGTDTRYLFCYFQGGWDLLLSLDPRDPALFRDDLKKTTRIQCGYDRLASRYRSLVPTAVDGLVLGPTMGSMARHASRLCVVRGMSMDTLTHEVGRRRFLTGHPPAGLQATGSSLSTVLAARLSAGEPVPQLSIGVESYNTDQATVASAIRVTGVRDLVRALRPGADEVSSEAQAALDALLAEQAACARFGTAALYRDARDYRTAAKGLVAQGLGDRFDFSAPTEAMAALRALYGIDPTDPEGAPAQCAAAVTALTSGVSRCVSVMPTTGLDQHGPEWSSTHPDRLASGFDLVAAMIDDLASREFEGTGDSWLDHTVVVGFSEFGRSPLLNSSGGRDHFLHNACFLAGAGIRGGAVIGASSDVGMAPQDIDLATGAVSPGGETVRPEHVFRALLHGVGVEDDVAGYGVEPLMAILR